MTVLLRHSKRVRLDSLGHLIPRHALYAMVGRHPTCRKCAKRLMLIGPKSTKAPS